jgi:hypothetical protein
MGYYNYGDGFIFDDRNPNCESVSKMQELFEKDSSNRDRVFPIIGGEEILDNPEFVVRRYVIDFADMSELDARRWPDLFEILERKVKPGRATLKRERLRKFWWQFGEIRPGLKRAT